MGWYARKVDANQAEIIRAYQQVGATVQTLQKEADGVPDLLIGWLGQNYLVECKSDTGQLTPAQVVFWRDWKGQKALVRNVDEALAVIGIGAATVPVVTLTTAQILKAEGHYAQLQTQWSGAKWRKGNRTRR